LVHLKPAQSDCLRAIAAAANEGHPESEQDPVERRKQTASKLAVLRAYYGAWPNAILQGLKKRSAGPVRADLWIIDLFAGRGWHESADAPEGRLPGTPAMAGLRLWQALHRPGNERVTAHLVAIDADQAFEKPLQATLEPYARSGMLDVRIEVANCADRIAELRRESRDGYSLWLFDPYGLRSIPYELFAPLAGSQARTEVLINLDAGGMRRAIDGPTKQQGRDLQTVSLPVMDCLFGDRSWRDLPDTMALTGDRQRWLVERYASRLRTPGRVVETWNLEGRADYRTLVQFAAHQTAITTFRRQYYATMKLWKKAKLGLPLADIATRLKGEFPDQTLTPKAIYWLGVLPDDISPSRINQACDRAMEMGLAHRSGSGLDGEITFTSVKTGLFD
jgi:three-Cys-motif partner protein